MYKEFRELSRADAVKSLYQDMAARHRARFRSIHASSVPRLVIRPANNTFADPPRRGDRKDLGHPSTLHQAVADPQSQVPSPTSGLQRQIHVCCASPGDILGTTLCSSCLVANQYDAIAIKRLSSQ